MIAPDAPDYYHRTLDLAGPAIRPRLTPLANGNGPLRSTTSQSTNCLVSAISTGSLNHGNGACQPPPTLAYHANQFLNNLIRMQQTKIWDDAKGRTFYARDNVCNFIKWSKEFGVNQSVLFESDDLVLHTNARQVVLCLLDVARIAYVKYGFTEAPGLVKFEQEIDRKLAAEQQQATYGNDEEYGDDDYITHVESSTDAGIPSTRRSSDNNKSDKKTSNRARGSRGLSIGDATDELIIRYCKHKEEEALRKKQQEDEESASALSVQVKAKAGAEAVDSTTTNVGQSNQTNPSNDVDSCQTPSSPSLSSSSPCYPSSVNENEAAKLSGQHNHDGFVSAPLPGTVRDHLAAVNSMRLSPDDLTTTPNGLQTGQTPNKSSLIDGGRRDSLDSGEGPTESATSTNHSGLEATNEQPISELTSLPIPSKRTSFSPSNLNQTESSMTNSEVSSSRSSLLSNQESSVATTNNHSAGSNHSSSFGRQITSDLDGKVMRIAKSYYGKGATKDVTRLSEGKYKIADRIVFVRLLKGHRVMVRIGGGWDTLENFLFRHKSDPSQVIDVDNLLPIETKMSFDKSPQLAAPMTPSHNNQANGSTLLGSPVTKSPSRLPYYRRSNSASSTNLSMSNGILITSNHSITSTRNNNPPTGHQSNLVEGRPSSAISTQHLHTPSSQKHQARNSHLRFISLAQLRGPSSGRGPSRRL